eukprot:184668_1
MSSTIIILCLYLVLNHATKIYPNPNVYPPLIADKCTHLYPGSYANINCATTTLNYFEDENCMQATAQKSLPNACGTTTSPDYADVIYSAATSTGDCTGIAQTERWAINYCYTPINAPGISAKAYCNGFGPGKGVTIEYFQDENCMDIADTAVYTIGMCIGISGSLSLPCPECLIFPFDEAEIFFFIEITDCVEFSAQAKVNDKQSANNDMTVKTYSDKAYFKIGVGISVVAVFLCIVAILFWWCKSKRNVKQNKNNPNDDNMMKTDECMDIN